MELQNVRIIQVQQLEIGISKAGKEWKKRSFVIETDNAEYPKKIFMSAWGGLSGLPFNEGDLADIQFDIESREYNGRWYTDIKAYNVLLNAKMNATRQDKPVEQKEEPIEDFPPPFPTKEDVPKEDPTSDLPF